MTIPYRSHSLSTFSSNMFLELSDELHVRVTDEPFSFSL